MKKNCIFYFDADYNWNNIYEDVKQWLEQKHLAFYSQFSKNTNIYTTQWPKSYVWGNSFIPQLYLSGQNWEKTNWNVVEWDLVLGFNIPKTVTNIFPSIREITQDKTIFEKLFPQYAIHSRVCYSYQDIVNHFKHISTPLKVLKPIKWTRSKGIIITDSLPASQDLESHFFPYLLQEFFDTSNGFYDFPWMHDFRIVMLSGKIIWKFLRQPASGKYTANSFRNGWFIDLREWELPWEIQKIVQDIESYCAKKFEHRYYSIDMGMGPHGELRVFELNSAPWLTDVPLARSLWAYIWKNILKVS